MLSSTRLILTRAASVVPRHNAVRAFATGNCKWFNISKGYGFITRSDVDDKHDGKLTTLEFFFAACAGFSLVGTSYHIMLSLHLHNSVRASVSDKIYRLPISKGRRGSE